MTRALGGLFALAILVTLVGVLAPTAGASEGLHIDAVTTYEVVSADSKISVTIEVEATNATPNTTKGGVTTRYFYDGFFVPVPVEAANITAFDGTRELRVTIEDSEDEDSFSVALVHFRSNLFFKRSRTVTVTYEIPGGDPRSEDSTRVNSAFVGFQLFAFGDPDGAEVRLVGLDDYQVSLDGERMTLETDEAGKDVRVAKAIADPQEWFVLVGAINDDALTITDHQFTGQTISIRNWPGDDQWYDTVSDTFELGLPALADLVGLAWPIDDTLVVTESIAPNISGFGGWFFVEDGAHIEIGEEVDRQIVLHEMSHAWFNDDLFVGRWIAEGFAEETASIVLREVFNEREFPTVVSAFDTSAVNLNAWVIPNVQSDLSDAREAYGYNASWSVIHDLTTEIGRDALAEVLLYAASDTIAYVGRPEPETWADQDDWRRLLDLFEEIGGSETATDVFADLVVKTDEIGTLEARSAAREKYRAFQTTTKRQPSYLIRKSMGDWNFDDAMQRMDEGLAVYELELTLVARATDMGLTTQDVFSLDFEMTRGGFNSVRASIKQHGRALDALAASEDAVAADRSLAMRMGLWLGEDPRENLDDARAAYERSDVDSVPINAALATQLLDDAETLGETRLRIAAGVLGFFVAAIVGLSIVLISRRRGRWRVEGDAVWAGSTSEPSLPMQAEDSGLHDGDPWGGDSTV